MMHHPQQQPQHQHMYGAIPMAPSVGMSMQPSHMQLQQHHLPPHAVYPGAYQDMVMQGQLQRDPRMLGMWMYQPSTVSQQAQHVQHAAMQQGYYGAAPQAPAGPVAANSRAVPRLRIQNGQALSHGQMQATPYLPMGPMTPAETMSQQSWGSPHGDASFQTSFAPSGPQNTTSLGSGMQPQQVVSSQPVSQSQTPQTPVPPQVQTLSGAVKPIPVYAHQQAAPVAEKSRQARARMSIHSLLNATEDDVAMG